MSIEIELLLCNTIFFRRFQKITFILATYCQLVRQLIFSADKTSSFFFFIPEQIRNHDSGSQRVEWQRTWACRNRELAGDSFHRVLVTLISTICSMNERRVSVNIFVQKKREERVVVLEDRSKSNGQRVLFHFIFFVFFFFFSSYKWIYGSIRVPVSCLSILELRDAEAKYGRRESFSRDMLIFHKLSHDNHVNENDL